MHAETDSTGSLTVASGESILFPVPTNATKKKGKLLVCRSDFLVFFFSPQLMFIRLRQFKVFC